MEFIIEEERVVDWTYGKVRVSDESKIERDIFENSKLSIHWNTSIPFTLGKERSIGTRP